MRFKTLLRDTTEVTGLAALIEKARKSNNHRIITKNLTQLKNTIFYSQFGKRRTQPINNYKTFDVEKYDRHSIKEKYKTTKIPEKQRDIAHVGIFYSLVKQLFLTLFDMFSKHP